MVGWLVGWFSRRLPASVRCLLRLTALKAGVSVLFPVFPFGTSAAVQRFETGQGNARTALVALAATGASPVAAPPAL